MNYLAVSQKAGDFGVFQIGQRGGNGKGEDLARLEGTAWIYMEFSDDHADIPKESLPLERGIGFG